MNIAADGTLLFDETPVFCPRCHGEGLIDHTIHPEGGVDEDVMVECPNCAGEGAIPYADYDEETPAQRAPLGYRA